MKRTTTLITVSALMLAVSSCDKDPNIDTNSRAYKIVESEQLIIPASIGIPTNLPGGSTRVATYYAEGVQKYKAQAKAGAPGYEWVFVAPLADLYDNTNKKVGTHGAGPFWQLSANDSIFAQPFMPARTAPSPSNSIDWLQLMPKTDKPKTGVFVNVAFIQRIATTGGKAPATPPQNITETADVPYTAVYRFTKINP